MMDIFLVKDKQVGEAHTYYDLLIHCSLPPALAEDLKKDILIAIEIRKRLKEWQQRLHSKGHLLEYTHEMIDRYIEEVILRSN